MHSVRLILLDMLGAIEAELDFSKEDIELVSTNESVESLKTAKTQLKTRITISFLNGLWTTYNQFSHFGSISK